MTGRSHLACCMSAICNPATASNPVAWFDLEAAGFPREALKEQVEAGEWMGPPPSFDKAPSRDSAIWRYMMEAENDRL